MSSIVKRISTPEYLFCILVFTNLLNYSDRGIIPGSSSQFNEFIMDSIDTTTPDVFLGLLQSSFIIGFSLSSLIFANLIHHYPPFLIAACGLSIWLCAVTMSGLAYYTKSYYFLMLARCISGVGEASFQVAVPPWIAIYSPSGKTATWMSIFYTAIPVGTAIGYTYSAAISSTIGWQFAFFFEVLLLAPAVVYLFVIYKEYPLGSIGSSRSSKAEPSSDTSGAKPTICEELVIVSKCPVYVLLLLGYAAQTFVLIGISTFGSSFLLNLGYFASESECSMVFGAIICVSGLIGTPLGGVVLDRISTHKENNCRRNHTDSSSDSEYNRLNLNDDTDDELYNPSPSDGRRVVKQSKLFAFIRDSDFEVLLADTQMITIASFLGTIFLLSIYFTSNKYVFIVLISLGSTLIFFCNSGINLAIILAVPSNHRSFAVAVACLTIHGLGDVPSPVITGYIKDRLAPDCTTTTNEACAGEKEGLRLTMLIITVWLFWTIFFFALAAYKCFNDLKLRRKSILDELLLTVDDSSSADDTLQPQGHKV